MFSSLQCKNLFVCWADICQNITYIKRQNLQSVSLMTRRSGVGKSPSVSDGTSHRKGGNWEISSGLLRQDIVMKEKGPWCPTICPLDITLQIARWRLQSVNVLPLWCLYTKGAAQVKPLLKLTIMCTTGKVGSSYLISFGYDTHVHKS